MVFDLNEWELATLSNPANLYEAVTSSRRYKPKLAAADGDCEFLTTEFATNGCVVCATIVHRTREAHLVLLNSEDLTAMRERLADLQVALNSMLLAKGSMR
jgi:hypothetical protein